MHACTLGLLELTTQELIALGIVSEVALDRLATVRAQHAQGLPKVRLALSQACSLGSTQFWIDFQGRTSGWLLPALF
jgi:hypothetical protein